MRHCSRGNRDPSFPREQCFVVPAGTAPHRSRRDDTMYYLRPRNSMGRSVAIGYLPSVSSFSSVAASIPSDSSTRGLGAPVKRGFGRGGRGSSVALTSVVFSLRVGPPSLSVSGFGFSRGLARWGVFFGGDAGL